MPGEVWREGWRGVAGWRCDWRSCRRHYRRCGWSGADCAGAGAGCGASSCGWGACAPVASCDADCGAACAVAAPRGAASVSVSSSVHNAETVPHRQKGLAMSEGYNGWTNYETWNVALWLDND